LRGERREGAEIAERDGNEYEVPFLQKGEKECNDLRVI